MRHIDFEAKSDRELLILVAQQGNETVDHLAKINDKLLKHERRITTLETRSGCEANSINLKSKLKSKWPTLSLLVSVLALIIIEVLQKI